MGKEKIVMFLVGLVMLVSGLYFFTSRVSVSVGFYRVSYGGISSGGLIVIPFIAGIIWIFAKPSSLGGKLMLGLGVLLILASIIMGTRFTFVRTSLYEYLIMLVLIFGGAALDLKVLLKKT